MWGFEKKKKVNTWNRGWMHVTGLSEGGMMEGGEALDFSLSEQQQRQQ